MSFARCSLCSCDVEHACRNGCDVVQKHMEEHSGPLCLTSVRTCSDCYSLVAMKDWSLHCAEHGTRGSDTELNGSSFKFRDFTDKAVDCEPFSKECAIDGTATCEAGLAECNSHEKSLFRGVNINGSIALFQAAMLGELLKDPSDPAPMFMFKNGSTFAWPCCLCPPELNGDDYPKFMNEISLRIYVIHHLKEKHDGFPAIRDAVQREIDILKSDINVDVYEAFVRQRKRATSSQRSIWFYLAPVNAEFSLMLYKMRIGSWPVSTNGWYVCIICFNAVRNAKSHFQKYHKDRLAHAHDSEFRSDEAMPDTSNLYFERFPFVLLQYSSTTVIANETSVPLYCWRCVLPCQHKHHSEEPVQFPTTVLLRMYILRHFETFHADVFADSFMDREWALLAKENKVSLDFREFSRMIRDSITVDSQDNYLDDVVLPQKIDKKLVPGSHGSEHFKICAICFWTGSMCSIVDHLMSHGVTIHKGSRNESKLSPIIEVLRKQYCKISEVPPSHLKMLGKLGRRMRTHLKQRLPLEDFFEEHGDRSVHFDVTAIGDGREADDEHFVPTAEHITNTDNVVPNEVMKSVDRTKVDDSLDYNPEAFCSAPSYDAFNVSDTGDFKVLTVAVGAVNSISPEDKPHCRHSPMFLNEMDCSTHDDVKLIETTWNGWDDNDISAILGEDEGRLEPVDEPNEAVVEDCGSLDEEETKRETLKSCPPGEYSVLMKSCDDKWRDDASDESDEKPCRPRRSGSRPLSYADFSHRSPGASPSSSSCEDSADEFDVNHAEDADSDIYQFKEDADSAVDEIKEHRGPDITKSHSRSSREQSLGRGASCILCPVCNFRLPPSSDASKAASLVAHFAMKHRDEEQALRTVAGDFIHSVESDFPFIHVKKSLAAGACVCAICSKGVNKLHTLIVHARNQHQNATPRSNKKQAFCGLCRKTWYLSSDISSQVGRAAHYVRFHPAREDDLRSEIGDIDCLETEFPFLQVEKSMRKMMLVCAICSREYDRLITLSKHAISKHPDLVKKNKTMTKRVSEHPSETADSELKTIDLTVDDGRDDRDRRHPVAHATLDRTPTNACTGTDDSRQKTTKSVSLNAEWRDTFNRYVQLERQMRTQREEKSTPKRLVNRQSRLTDFIAKLPSRKRPATRNEDVRSAKRTKDTTISPDSSPTRDMSPLDEHTDNEEVVEGNQSAQNNGLFMCEECNFEDDAASSLAAHCFTVHKHNTGNWPATCPHCKKLFRTRRPMLMHITRTHMDIDKAFPCRYCDKFYEKRPAMRSHEVHFHEEKFGVAPTIYQCQYCPRKFSSAGYLRLHEAGGSHRICNYCKEEFKSVSDCKDHEETCSKNVGSSRSRSSAKPVAT